MASGQSLLAYRGGWGVHIGPGGGVNVGSPRVLGRHKHLGRVGPPSAAKAVAGHGGFDGGRLNAHCHSVLVLPGPGVRLGYTGSEQ